MMIKYSKCGHETTGVIIADVNVLSMSSYLEWSDSVGVFGDKTICYDCWCNEEKMNTIKNAEPAKNEPVKVNYFDANIPPYIEKCENCGKLITEKMKESQEVIYASAEHTLTGGADDFCDPMFNGPFCCDECYKEISGINLAYKIGRKEGRQEAFKEVEELIDGKTIECVLLYGEWWMKLNEFKEKLKAKETK
jgi:hypothetical protein